MLSKMGYWPWALSRARLLAAPKPRFTSLRMRRTGIAGGGEIAGDHLGGAVCGGVIDYEDFGGLVVGETGAFGEEGFEAVAQQVAGIVGDDDDGDRVRVGGAEVHRNASSIVRDGVGLGSFERGCYASLLKKLGSRNPALAAKIRRGGGEGGATPYVIGRWGTRMMVNGMRMDGIEIACCIAEICFSTLFSWWLRYVPFWHEPQVAGAGVGVTHLRVTREVILPGVTRLGINLGEQNFYDSGQMMKNLLYRNPGFEGMKYRSILHCTMGGAGQCVDTRQRFSVAGGILGWGKV